MNEFTFEETNLMCIYNTGSREGLITALEEMQEHLEADETELKSLTVSTLAKLRKMTDEELNELLKTELFVLNNNYQISLCSNSLIYKYCFLHNSFLCY